MHKDGLISMLTSSTPLKIVGEIAQRSQKLWRNISHYKEKGSVFADRADQSNMKKELKIGFQKERKQEKDPGTKKFPDFFFCRTKVASCNNPKSIQFLRSKREKIVNPLNECHRRYSEMYSTLLSDPIISFQENSSGNGASFSLVVKLLSLCNCTLTLTESLRLSRADIFPMIM